MFAKKLFAGSIITLALIAGLAFPANASYSDPLPNASCEGGTFKIYMNPQGVSSRHAVRIDDLSNPWNPENMQPGDSLNNNTKGSAYVVTKEVAHEYSWWIHSVDENGVYSAPKGGRVYCRLNNPTNVTGTYEYPYVIIRWDAVPGAVRYAVRADNHINGWNPTNPNDGDHVLNNVTTTEFRFKAARDRVISFWVHAVDKYGAYSDPTNGKTFRTQ